MWLLWNHAEVSHYPLLGEKRGVYGSWKKPGYDHIPGFTIRECLPFGVSVKGSPAPVLRFRECTRVHSRPITIKQFYRQMFLLRKPYPCCSAVYATPTLGRLATTDAELPGVGCDRWRSRPTSSRVREVQPGSRKTSLFGPADAASRGSACVTRLF